MKLQDALCIQPRTLETSLSGKPPTDLKQLVNLVLHKLISYDTLCMSDLMQSDSEEKEEDTPAEVNGVHPVDCLLALILCSDDFLCQDLL